MNLILLFFLVASGALAVRLFLMQIVHHREYLDLAAKQHGRVEEFASQRGIIFVQDGEKNLVPLALNQNYKVLVASPSRIENPSETARELAQTLGLDEAEVLRKLSKIDDPYEIIARKIDEETVDRIAALELPGLSFEDETRRVYPDAGLAAHLIGFVSAEQGEEAGQYGLERTYNEDLAGSKGILEGAKDAAGFWIALGRRILVPPKNGSSLVLTLDYTIQRKAEEIGRLAREKSEARQALILVLEPKTGRILAEAVDPTFDPNLFSQQEDLSIFLNPAVESRYELGSVVKPLTMAAGIAERKVQPDSRYQDTGIVRIGGVAIHNYGQRSYGWQTMTQVLERSLNTGAVHVARLLGPEAQREYLERFGLGEETGVDLPGEIAGDISNLTSGREIDFATASFGQGIATTPLQLARAIGAIANGGRLMRPYVGEKSIDDSGNEVRHTPEVGREVVPAQTAETITKMLVSAVRNGIENRAGVKGYFVAGKTGTAQVPRKDGRGYSDEVIHTFVGYAPAFDPRFLIFLQLNEPKSQRSAAPTLTPAFHDLAEFILNYYEVPPDEK